MFVRERFDGSTTTRSVGLDCSGDDPIVEQSHKDEVDINAIVRKHGVDMIQRTAAMMAPAMRFDDVTGNDFQEAMLKVSQAQETFDSLPSLIRKEFDNNPAKYLDFVQNPDNIEKMYDMGLAERPAPEAPPVKVEVVPTQSPETPPK